MATGTTSEKIPNRWGRRVEDLKFLGGILKNYTAETPEIKKKKKKKKLALPGVLKKVLLFGPGSSMRCNNFSRAEGQSFILSGISGVTNLKSPQFFSFLK